MLAVVMVNVSKAPDAAPHYHYIDTGEEVCYLKAPLQFPHTDSLHVQSVLPSFSNAQNVNRRDEGGEE